MGFEFHHWNIGDALLLRFRRVCCPRIAREIAAEWTPNRREFGRGTSATMSLRWPHSGHAFVRALSEGVDSIRPQTCPQSVRELVANLTATWLDECPENIPKPSALVVLPLIVPAGREALPLRTSRSLPWSAWRHRARGPGGLPSPDFSMRNEGSPAGMRAESTLDNGAKSAHTEYLIVKSPSSTRKPKNECVWADRFSGRTTHV